LFIVTVPAGFPSPAEDYAEGPLDLNRYLIHHPAATFFVRVKGDSMIGAGIFCGDLLIVDRALMPNHGNVVIAVVNGDLTVKRFHQEARRGQDCARAARGGLPATRAMPSTA
jgi:DNA polymerase V